MKSFAVLLSPIWLALTLLFALLVDLLAPPSRFSVAYATYKYWGGGSKINSSSQGLRAGPEGFSIIDVKLDFAAIAAQRIADGQAALAAADVLEVISLNAFTYVLAVFARVLTAEGAACTIDVGDGVAANAFLDDFNLNAVGMGGSLVTTAGSVAVGGGRLYTAADTIDVLLNNNATDVAVVHLFGIAMQLDPYRT